MWGRKREQAVQADELLAAQESVERADTLGAEVGRRRPTVESLASSLTDRRTKNGFGEDYEISKTLRWG